MVNSCVYNRLFDNKNMSGGALKKINFTKLLKEKQGFLLLVFGNLIVQLGITYYIFTKAKMDKYKKYQWLIIVGLFAILFIIALVPMPIWLKFILFCMFSFLQGLFLSIIKTKENGPIILSSILSALGIFFFFALVGGFFISIGINLTSKFGLFLFIILLFLIIFQLVQFFFASNGYNKLFAYIGLFLFSLFVIYDTNRMLQRNYYGDFITASMDYYLDILNLILDVFNIKNN